MADMPIKELFAKGDENLQSMWGNQAGSVLTYLLGPGNRGKRTKNIVQNYMGNLILAIEEATAEFDKKNKKIEEDAKKQAEEEGNAEESEDEAEEEEGDAKDRWEQITEALKSRAAAIRKIAFDKTFGELTDKDWKKLDRAWRSYAG